VSKRDIVAPGEGKKRARKFKTGTYMADEVGRVGGRENAFIKPEKSRGGEMQGKGISS